MEPITMVLIGGLAYAGYKKFIEKPSGQSTLRFVGDLAKVGDEVVVSVNNLNQINKDLPVMPPGTALVTVEVQGADLDRLQGPIVAFGQLRIPAKIGSFVVHRVIVDKVIRDGKVATSISGSGSRFTGERRQFQG